MIGISKLYCGSVEPSDPIRYGRDSSKLPSHLLQFSKDKKPVIAWNMTQRCNLECLHCYSHSGPSSKLEGMTPEEELSLINDLAEFKIPVLLFSGGEPLMHPRIMDLLKYTVSKGIRAVLSTNGTLINEEKAKQLKEIGLSYVGISIDGLEETHNKFRRNVKAFELALNGIENCNKHGLKVGLRFTITKYNYKEINGIFDLLEEKAIPRICLYHLAYSGRGKEVPDAVLENEKTREVVELIIKRTEDLHSRGKKVEVLTVNNHCDGVFLYLKAMKEDPEKASKIIQLLKMNGGNNSGIGIACIDWNGNVFPDQFWRNKKLGNVKEHPFSKLWDDKQNKLIMELRDRKSLLKGRCSTCIWLDLCNGNSRARAEAINKDFWLPDPACYLSDNEISIPPEEG